MKVTNLFTQADREVFDRIDRDCLAMHVPTPPKTFLKLEVRDGAGELTDVYEDRAHSWNRNAYNAFLRFVCAGGNIGSSYAEGSLYAKAISGATMSAPAYFDSWGPAGSYDGIIVGSGVTAETFDQWQFTQILTGSTAGTLVYNEHTANNTLYDSVTKKFTRSISRVFNNNSGNDVNVTEIGITRNAGAGNLYLFCRDLLAEAKTVPNAGQLTVTYTIEMTFPA